MSSTKWVAGLRATSAGTGVLEPGSAEFEVLAGRFATHPGVDLRYVAAVRPTSAEEVREVVALAHREGAGLLTVFNASDVGARLHGAGDTLILDLSRMDRVLEVDVPNGYARVEPGVSYAGLAAHLAQQGLPLLVDSERDPQASIAGSTFAKGFGMTPYGDHALVQCGAEFALPYGELMRTGMGAMPGSRTWQLYKYALGPYADGLALQCGLLVPTQMGVWLMGQVPRVDVLAWELKDDAALAATIEVLRGLKIANLLPGTVGITHRDLDVLRYADEAPAAPWRLATALYGLPKLIDLARAAVGGALAGIPGVKPADPVVVAASRYWQDQSARCIGKVPAKPDASPSGGRSATLTLVAPVEDRFAAAMLRGAREAVQAAGLPLHTEFALLGRSLLQQVHLPYAPGDAAGVARLAACARRIAAAVQADGIGVAGTSFELAGLGLGVAPGRGLDVLHRRIEAALIT